MRHCVAQPHRRRHRTSAHLPPTSAAQAAGAGEAAGGAGAAGAARWEPARAAASLTPTPTRWRRRRRGAQQAQAWARRAPRGPFWAGTPLWGCEFRSLPHDPPPVPRRVHPHVLHCDGAGAAARPDQNRRGKTPSCCVAACRARLGRPRRSYSPARCRCRRHCRWRSTPASSPHPHLVRSHHRAWLPSPFSPLTGSL